MNLTKEELSVLRYLAGQVRELSQTQKQQKLKERWLRHNRLEPEYPMVLAFPEGAWREIIPSETLVTINPLLRQWELRLRQIIYTHEHIRDDSIFDGVFTINWVHEPINWGLTEKRVQRDTLGSYSWDPPLKFPKDIERLSMPNLRINADETYKQQEIAIQIFGDLIPVEIRGRFWWSLGMMTHAIMLRGLEQFMMDMYDNPGWLHELMTILRDGTESWITQLENGGYLSFNNRSDYVGSGGFGYTDQLPQSSYNKGHVRLCDLWGFAEAQELSGVSPSMFVEFALNYQIPLLKRFGLNCYGCCEPVHDRLQYIKMIPNLRRISISPWADIDKCAKSLEDKYIFSYKPNPAVLASTKLDEEAIKEHLEKVLQRTRGCRVEIIMKDTHTVNNQPERITRWVELAREAIENVVTV